ncbi:MAG: hypothetical protein M3Q62_03005 [Actinomycetota bacterium]|nr:hypothetical protein [Actinomycetota bacterium]
MIFGEETERHQATRRASANVTIAVAATTVPARERREPAEGNDQAGDRRARPGLPS